MKREYVKPHVFYENFELASNISMCELISSKAARFQCPVTDAEVGWDIFTDLLICTVTPADGDTICYEVPMEDYNVYSS